MNITLIYKRARRWSLIEFGISTVFLIAIVATLFLGGVLYGGFYLGKAASAGSELTSVTSFRNELQSQKAEVDNTIKMYQENMNAMATRLGQMQARMLRLDALGRRLTEVANLRRGEFDFDNLPAQGGPEVSDQSGGDMKDILANLDQLAKQLVDREHQLNVLENLILNKRLQEQVFPSGWPIKKGWISSYFGMRTDPFTGKRARHEGIDFAGKEGSPVVSVASGVVVFAGRRHGYGLLVEINHGNGYFTRYGHNKAILVKSGERVEKGQTLAHMGSTGRSTGPHTHFEVLKDGRVVNPIKYIKASR